MKVVIEVNDTDAVTFFEELNKDDGMREKAVTALMKQTSPEWVSNKTAVIRVLGAFSAGFHAALDEARLFNKRQRHRELLKLAFPN